MQPDERVTPSIRLVRLLGRGGMGSVWVAWHERLKTEVVVKFLMEGYADHPEVLARFEREAALAAQVKSPHVVQVFDYGVAENGLPYIAMEYLEGEDLGARIRRESPIPPRLFAEWLRQACSGLARVHAKNIVHRDIKPDNLFLCSEQLVSGEIPDGLRSEGDVLVKLLDFGVAKSEGIFDTRTQTSALLGTPYFMSPEQAMSAKDVDSRSDLWALGVVAYYALTGELPFPGESIGPVVLAITGSEPPRPSTLEPELPRAVDAWMSKALAKDPERRFQSAAELANAFLAATGRAPAAFDSKPVRAPRRRAPVPAAWHATTLSPATVQDRVQRGESPPPPNSGGLLKAFFLGTLKAFFGALAILIVAGAVVLLRLEERRPKGVEARSGSARPGGALLPSGSSSAVSSEPSARVATDEPPTSRTKKGKRRSSAVPSPGTSGSAQPPVSP